MSIDIKTAARVAKLARIRVDEAQLPALAQEFGRQGVGYLLAPEVLVDEIESRHQVQHIGTIDGVEEHFYAISVERRITHSCVLAITRAARGELFQSTARANGSRAAQRRKPA